MIVDMYERTFVAKLRDPSLRLPGPGPAVSLTVRNIDFPAWRALFSSMLLFGHSTGYRLPTFDEFYQYCRRAYTSEQPRMSEQYVEKVRGFRARFDGPDEPQIRERIRQWYESGMAETYLYVCLVDAFEDKLREGVVVYDPRVDWKLKCDLVVRVREHTFGVNAFQGNEIARARVEAQRLVVEQDRKRNTPDSAQWNNLELRRWTRLSISKTENDYQEINGFHLFSPSAVNTLVDHICRHAGLDSRVRFPGAAVVPMEG